MRRQAREISLLVACVAGKSQDDFDAGGWRGSICVGAECGGRFGGRVGGFTVEFVLHCRHGGWTLSQADVERAGLMRVGFMCTGVRLEAFERFDVCVLKDWSYCEIQRIGI